MPRSTLTEYATGQSFELRGPRLLERPSDRAEDLPGRLNDQPEQSSLDEIRNGLRERLDLLAREYRVPGAQLAVRLGTTTYAAHTGTADVTTGAPFTAGTAVPTGSVTKCCTAALVMMLAADGDLELDDPVRDHLPELRDADGFTVAQVLSHTAGLPAGPESDTAAATTAARYLAAHCSPSNAVAPPGTGFSYSNVGYVAAGRLVEAVTGMSWRDAARAMLLEPLGLDAAFLGEAAPAASGHSVNTAVGRVRAVGQNLAPLEDPAGALLASALDLVALGRALAGRGSRSPLTARTAELMRRPAPNASPGVLADGWGLGLALFGQDGPVWFGHDGNAQGTSCHLRVEPVSGTAVAFTSNSNNGTALWHAMAAEVTRLTGAPVPAVPAERPRAREVLLPEAAGTYRNGTVDYTVAPLPGGSPALSVNGDTPARLVCYADLAFDLVDPETDDRLPGGRFVRGPAGAIDRLQVSGRAARRV